MRTIQRKTQPLNTGKQVEIEKLCHAYTCETQYWLTQLQNWEWQAFLETPRKIRDTFVAEGYRSPYGLQARHWKLAQQDAIEMWDKYWQAIFVQVRPKIARRKNMSDNERHYAYLLLKNYSHFAELMQGKAPLPHFDLDPSARQRTANFVRKTVKKLRGKSPVAKKGRIAKFDSNCYEVCEHNGKQYIKLMSLQRGKRIVVPLLGKTKITGNITVVLTKTGPSIHVSQELQPRTRQGSTEAVDFGYSEVMTDTEGMRYGKQFGEILTKASNKRHEKMQKRHKLHAQEKKQRSKNPKKAARVRKYNLGHKKLHSTTKKAQATLEREINTGINELLEKKTPAIVITEDLRHPFTYNKSKNVNRRLSSWLRGKLQDRIAFKALAEGFRHEQVNPAYGSQACPQCDYVDHRNRTGDRFVCLHCRHEDCADRVAALNYLRRFGDEEIGRYMPYSQVKTILLQRFHRRLETGKPVTVPGRTLETVTGVNPQQPVETLKKVTAGRGNSLNRAVTQRAKHNEHV